MTSTIKNITLYTLIALLLSSCVTHDELLNFNTGPEFPTTPVEIQNLPQLTIQPDDLLSIRIKALDPIAAMPFNIDPENMNMQMMNASGGMRPLIGYLVDREGTIDMPMLGKIKVLGKTTDEIRQIVLEKLKPFLNNPVVSVRFLNFRITVLGEVSRPGTFFVANERVTVLDMLGLAGDVTSYGNRTNILVIREEDGRREYARLNIQDRDIFQSPYFYLQQNDVLYVEPLPVRTASIRDQSTRILPWLSAITALTTLALTLSNI
ncbi:MAG: polysaccharide biosynthesis/export family protein [Phaeodactylibacter sp.]|uniref:polysaccharide biosynthesis/export family protein n=1 Tax=Phaeodactylibacter sp. TaxID=1940289 RepID=UPI0032EDBD65